MHDMFSEANHHAAVIREFYEAYLRAGFSEAQAEAFTVVLLAGLAQGSAK